MVDVKIKVVESEKFTDKQKKDVKDLQQQVFVDVDEKEAKEDFYNPEVAGVFAYLGENLVGYAGVHESRMEFEGEMIKLGGYGIGVREDMRRKGIAAKMCQEAMKYLKEKGYDLAFLSIDASKAWTDKLHKKVGFVHLPRKFAWKNVHGNIKESDGGMIAPVNSKEKFEKVLNGKDVFYVGEGYW